MGRMTRLMTLVALLPLVLFAAPGDGAAQDFDLTGKWVLTVSSPNGSGTRELTLVQKDGELTGSISSSMATGDLTGSVEGTTVTFVAGIFMDSGAFEIVYNATYVDGELKDGVVDFGDYGGGTFTGRRKPEGG